SDRHRRSRRRADCRPVALGICGERKLYEARSLHGQGPSGWFEDGGRLHGHGCPYSRKVTVVTRSKATVNLVPQFQTSQLKPGATITVSIVRAGWTGRYYSFTIRANKAPMVSTGCLAEGTLKRTRC